MKTLEAENVGLKAIVRTECYGQRKKRTKMEIAEEMIAALTLQQIKEGRS